VVTGIVNASVVDHNVVFGALMGAIVWNVLTWLLGIPSSSSHALVGGILGAGTAKAGFSVIVWSGLGKTLFAIVLSPTVGLLLALFATTFADLRGGVALEPWQVEDLLGTARAITVIEVHFP